MKLKIGVLGVSNHLIKRIILPLKNTQNCELFSVASRDIAKAKICCEKYGFKKYFGAYEELLEDKEINAVYIPLPNHMHLEWIEKAARAGKHILCEKPIALNEIDAVKCFEVAKANNVLLMEAFMYQFHPMWIHAKNMVDTKQIGNIQYIHTSFAYNNPDPKNIRNIITYGGGAIMDIGCYAISVPRFILGKEPEKVVSLIKKHPEFKTDYLSSAMMDFGKETASFTVSTLSEGNQKVEIVGASGVITVKVPFNTYVDTKAEITVSTPQGLREIDFEVCDQYGLMFEHFADCVVNNKKPGIAEADTVGNMRVIDALFRSAAEQSWISLK